MITDQQTVADYITSKFPVHIDDDGTAAGRWIVDIIRDRDDTR